MAEMITASVDCIFGSWSNFVCVASLFRSVTVLIASAFFFWKFNLIWLIYNYVFGCHFVVIISFYFYSFVSSSFKSWASKRSSAAATSKDRISWNCTAQIYFRVNCLYSINAFSASASEDLDSSRSADCLVFAEDEFLDEWCDDNHGNLYCADDVWDVNRISLHCGLLCHDGDLSIHEASLSLVKSYDGIFKLGGMPHQPLDRANQWKHQCYDLEWIFFFF